MEHATPTGSFLIPYCHFLYTCDSYGVEDTSCWRFL